MSRELASESETVELPAEPPAHRRPFGFWRELSGTLAYGLCALAVVVLAFQVVAWLRGNPGPGWVSVGGHLGIAVAAVLAQRFAERRRGWPGMVAVVGVLVLGGAALWIFWWA